MHVHLVSSQEAGGYIQTQGKKLALCTLKCRFMCMCDIFSLREVHIYTRGGHSRKAKRDFEVNPCLLSSNKSRPHLSSYIVISEGQKGAVRWILSMASRHEAFPWTWGANSLQTSHKAEVLPSNNSKVGWIARGYKQQVRKSAPFRITGKLRCKMQIMASNKYKKLT